LFGLKVPKVNVMNKTMAPIINSLPPFQILFRYVSQFFICMQWCPEGHLLVYATAVSTLVSSVDEVNVFLYSASAEFIKLF